MNIRRRARIACAFAIILAGVINAGALRNPFIYDDYRLIVENRAMTGHMSLNVLLGLDATRPVATLSYAADRVLWGSGPFGFHLTSIVLHMIAVGLFALFVWRLVEDRRARGSAGENAPRAEIVAPIAALLFAVHPLVSAAVGYISARPETICAVFVLLALLAVRRWMLGHGGIWLGATVVCWLVALGAKETALVFPVIALAYDRWVLPPQPGAARHHMLFLHAPLFALALVFAVSRLLVFIVIEHGGAFAIQWPLALVEFDVLRRYLMLLFVPGGQAIFHSIAPIDNWLQPRALAGLSVVLLSMWFIWAMRRTRPLLSLGVLWFFLFLAPSAALVVLDRGEPMVDHRVYVAACGMFLVAGIAADRVWSSMASGQRASRVVLVAGFAVVIFALSARTMLHHALWRNPVLVWLDAAERAPADWLPHRVLGEELHRAGRHDDAIAALTRALELGPEQVSTYGKLGVCLTEKGNLDLADAAFSKLQRFDPRSPEASNGLATLALLRGQIDVAKQKYMDTLTFDASNVPARRGLIVIAEGPGGNPADAVRWCQDIQRLEPESADAQSCIRKNEARPGGRGNDGR